jgi:hypothetical protein
MTHNGALLRLNRLDTGTVQTYSPAAAAGAPLVSIGARSDGAAQVDAMTGYEFLLYNRVLGMAELQRIRREVKRWWLNNCGVTIL